MPSPDIDQLNERQKKILRLVLYGHSSKSIARELGGSRHTIDGDVRAALRILCVGDRWAAARLLAEAERTLPQPLIPQALSVSDAEEEPVPNTPSAPGWSGDDRQEQSQVKEERIPPPWPSRPLHDRRAEGRRNHLSAGERLARIGRTAVAVVSVFATIAFAMFLLQRLFEAMSFPAH